MTVVPARLEGNPKAQEDLLLVAAAAGCLALAARGVSWRAIAVTLAVGAAASLAPSRRNVRASTHACALALALGVAAFVFVRLRVVALPYAVTMAAGGASLAGAVAEEVFFRRLVYDALARWGAPVAVVGAAIAFAAIHVPAYGVMVIPLDLAAGLVLGWQRSVTGTWTVPAITHVVANLLSMV